jgi:hypothetical protein
MLVSDLCASESDAEYLHACHKSKGPVTWPPGHLASFFQVPQHVFFVSLPFEKKGHQLRATFLALVDRLKTNVYGGAKPKA